MTTNNGAPGGDEPRRDNIHEFPGTQRAQQMIETATAYLARLDLSVAHEDPTYVMELAGLLSSENGWKSFANAVRSRHAQQPDHAVTKDDMKAYLATLLSAVKAVWAANRARERAQQDSNASITDVAGMLNSDSPFLTCLGLLLTHWKGRIWWDDFRGAIMTNWRGDEDARHITPVAMNDAIARRIRTWLMKKHVAVLGNLSENGSNEAVATFADMDVRDMLIEHVRALPAWDGVPRLDGWLKQGFGCPVDEDAGQTEAYIKAVGRNALIGMIARALKPGCKLDTMVVLYGGQGDRKSTALRVLAGGGFFTTITESPSNKDFYMKLQGVWLGEVAELASIASSKVNQAKVKATLSIEEDTFRPPYGRAMKTYKRRTVLFGTTNEQTFMRDPTGNRRFPTVTVGRIDIEWLTENRDQLLAEALKEYRAGASWWEFPKEDHERVVQAHQTTSIYHDEIAARLMAADLFDGTSAGPELVRDDTSKPLADLTRWGNTVTPLRVALQWLGLPLEQAQREQSAIKGSLRQLGWHATKTSRREGGWKHDVRCWVVMDRAARTKLREERGLEGAAVSEQGIIPF